MNFFMTVFHAIIALLCYQTDNRNNTHRVYTEKDKVGVGFATKQ